MILGDKGRDEEMTTDFRNIYEIRWTIIPVRSGEVTI